MKSTLLTVVLAFAPPVFAQPWLKDIFDQVAVNRAAMQGTGAQSLVTAVVRFREAPDSALYVQLLEVTVPTKFQLSRVGFDEPLIPGSRYYVIEIARPYRVRDPNVISPGTRVRLLREDAEGRLFWRAGTNDEYEVSSVTGRSAPLGRFRVTAAGEELSHDQVLSAWETRPAARPAYFGGPARPACEAAVAVAKPKFSLLNWLFGPL